MNWVKNHTCKNCKWSAKVNKLIMESSDNITILSNDDNYAVNWCLHHKEKIISSIERCTCDCWTEDCEATAKTMIKEEHHEGALKFCRCGHKPKCFRRVFSDNGTDDWAVWCECCDAMTVADTKHGAISLWNNGY